MLRFYFALWVSKLAMWVLKLRGSTEDDRPGLLANKICPDYLAKIAKPPLVITVTGTNGKSTTTALLNNKLVAEGKKVSFNEWGANMNAGYAVNLMRCVNIFNKPVYDVSILEADERLLDTTMGMIKLNYILVTNICKDSPAQERASGIYFRDHQPYLRGTRRPYDGDPECERSDQFTAGTAFETCLLRHDGYRRQSF